MNYDRDCLRRGKACRANRGVELIIIWSAVHRLPRSKHLASIVYDGFKYLRLDVSMNAWFPRIHFKSLKAVSLVLIIAITVNLMGTISVANSVTMNREEIGAMVRRQATAWENGDVSAIIADFAEDALFIAARKEFKGKKAIQKAAEDYFAQFGDVRVKIIRIIVEDNSGAVQWDWSDRNRQTEVASYAEDAIIFELKDNKIIYWREYIEKVS